MADGMKTYLVTLTGKSPLLMHWDNLDGAAQLKRWREAPENQKDSVKGDDRSPAHTWIFSTYNDGTRVAIPQDNIARCAMEGGAQVPVPGGKNGKTFKTQSQSGMMAGEAFWPLLVGGKEIPWSKIAALAAEHDFDKHCQTAMDLGFELYVKRAKIGASKHVRVRPRFNKWSTSGTIVVWDAAITLRVLKDIFRLAGDFKGIGDWRPSGRTPGPFGRFDAEIEEM